MVTNSDLLDTDGKTEKLCGLSFFFRAVRHQYMVIEVKMQIH